MRVYTLSDMRSEKKLRVYTASEAKGLIVPYYCRYKRGNIITIRADFQQGMESVSLFKDEHSDCKLLAHLCSSNGNMALSCGV